ncbi:uncharacterized protein LOC130988812 [Salvia miltiorrhiza]|uniref:uncharacterized protein LOC130988812 n=1 Tax=Salvia miltiorrhiza TaxID=226208 RepID=UPI0025AC162A|nr:uncharacterized protein LOC130988812 [Salvia miltiorrhiza]
MNPSPASLLPSVLFELLPIFLFPNPVALSSPSDRPTPSAASVRRRPALRHAASVYAALPFDSESVHDSRLLRDAAPPRRRPLRCSSAAPIKWKLHRNILNKLQMSLQMQIQMEKNLNLSHIQKPLLPQEKRGKLLRGKLLSKDPLVGQTTPWSKLK